MHNISGYFGKKKIKGRYKEMKKKIFYMCMLGVIIVCGCSKKTENPGSETMVLETETTQYGWSMDETKQIFHTDAESGDEEMVLKLTDIDTSLNDSIGSCFFNENCAFISYFSKEKEEIAVEYSEDGGKSWSKTFVSYKEHGGPNETYLSFVDKKTGYLLYLSDPATGSMNKILYVSKDGGKTFKEQADISYEMRNQPCDMLFFTEQCGFLTTINYGEEAYLYQTEDGGITWSPVELNVPKIEEFSYVNGVSLEKAENSNEQATLTVKGVGVTENVYLKFVTKDSGKTWNLSEE